MGHLTLSLLGGFEASLYDQPLTHFESNKVRALLVYLAVEADYPHRRESLAALLWPDFSEQAALANLRVALADLRDQIRDRQTNPPFLLVSRESIQFNRRSNASVDVWEFERIANLELRVPVDDLSAAPGHQLLAFRPFLNGFSIPDSNLFEEWVSLKREHLKQQALRLLQHLANSYESCGAYETALLYARRQVELEPWLEETHRQIMRLLVRSDQRSAALAQFETCKRILAEELGIEPALETVRLFEIIRSGRLADINPGERSPFPGEAPFKGLQFFDQADSTLFYGRETLTQHLLDHVREVLANIDGLEPKGLPNVYPLFAVIGASGGGKSSLVRAGLVPALRREGYVLQVITPGQRPTVPMAPAYQESGKVSILVIDQFEELFTLCHNDTERQQFLDDLLMPAGRKRTGWAGIILVLRADFYGHCAQYSHLREALGAHQEYIGSMDAAELRRAIEEPARRNGWDLEPGLVDTILLDVGASDGQPPEPGALPLLEHALLETWKRRSGRILTHKGYKESGGVRGAIAHTADTVLAQLSPAEQQLACQVFLRLTELGEGSPDRFGSEDTRRRVNRSELLASAAESTMMEGLLQTLAAARLITLATDTVEVAHEALIREWPTLRRWLSENRDGLRLQRHITESAQAWDHLARDPRELYHGARLAQALEWAAQAENSGSLNDLERQFLQASQVQAGQEAAERELQRQRELHAAQQLARTQRQRTWVVSMGLGVAIFLIGVASWLYFAANQNLKGSEALRLAAEANKLLIEGKNSETSALLALRSLELQYTFQGDEALARASRMNYPLQIFRGHTAAVRGVVFIKDGTQIVTNSMDRTSRVWDVSTGQVIQQFEGVTGDGVWIDSTSDGRIVAGNASTEAVVWDGTSGEIIFRIGAAETGGGLSAITIDLSSDGRYLLLGHQDGIARIWDVVTGQEVQGFPGHQNGPTAAVFSPDDRLVLTSDIDAVRLYDIASGELRQSFTGHQDETHGLAFSPDSRKILTASLDKTARLWDVQTGQEIWRWQHSTRLFFQVAISPDGRYALAGADDGVAYLLDMQTGAEIRRFTQSEWIAGVAFSPDGRTLATTSFDGTACLWAVEPELAQPEFALPGTNFYYLAFSPNGSSILAGASDNQAHWWEIDSRQELAVFGGHDQPVYNVGFSADGSKILTAEKNIFLWDAATQQVLSRFEMKGGYLFTQLSPDGKTVLVVNTFKDAYLYDALNGEELHFFSGGNYTQTVDFSSDGRRIALGRGDNNSAQVDVMDFPDLKEALILHFPGDVAVLDLEFSRDGRSILASAAGWENAIRLWDTTSGKVLWEFSGHTGLLWGVALSPDGRYAAAGGNDTTVHIWDTVTGQEVRRLVGHQANIIGVVFSPDGKTIASSSADGTVKLWSMDLDALKAEMCKALPRDLTPAERTRYGILDTHPTCPKFRP